jgi:hypothetical protein
VIALPCTSEKLQVGKKKGFLQRDCLYYGGMEDTQGATSDMFRVSFLVTEDDIEIRGKVHSISPSGRAPLGRRRHVAEVYRGEFMFVACGRSQYHWFNDVWVYSVSTNIWVELTPSIPGTLLRNVYDINLANRPEGLIRLRKQMERLAAIPPDTSYAHRCPLERRTGASGYIVGDTFFISMGYLVQGGAPALFNDVVAYDILSHRFFVSSNIGSKAPEARSMGTCVYVEDKDAVFCFGGRIGNSAAGDFYLCHHRPRTISLKELTVRFIVDHAAEFAPLIRETTMPLRLKRLWHFVSLENHLQG